VTPSSVAEGTTTTVAVSGANYDPNASVAISGTGVRVKSETAMSSKMIVATLVTDPSAAIGQRDVTVRSAGTTATCGGCLIVIAGG
jgi:hypothetical protein